MKVIHIVMTKLSLLRQEIYEHLELRSQLYLKAVKSDLASLTEEEKDVFAMDCFRPLRTVYLISLELGVEYRTVQELLNYVRMCGSSSPGMPVYFLDKVRQCSSVTADEREHVRFLRDVIRCVGLVAVLMGTNSTAANLAKAAEDSRGRHTRLHWCTVITDLPKVSPNCFKVIRAGEMLDGVKKDFPALETFLKEQFQTSNPFFVGLIVSSWFRSTEEYPATPRPCIELFETVLSGAHSDILEAKKSLTDVERGLRGQFMMFLAAHRDTETSGEVVARTLVEEEPDDGDDEGVPYEIDEWNGEEEEDEETEEEEVEASLVVVRDGSPRPTDIFSASSEDQVAYHFAQLHQQNHARLSLAIRNGHSYLQNMDKVTSFSEIFAAMTISEEPGELREVLPNKWIPSAKFPSLQSDALMFLLLSGGKNRPTFFSAWGELSTATLYNFLSRTVNTSSEAMDVSNPAALKRDGDTLEGIGCVALCVASHRNGLAGMDLRSFLLSLADELSVGRRYRWGAPSIKVQQIIPFLSPPNDPWPGSFMAMARECGGNVADVLRPPNSKMVDIVVQSGGSVIFTAEIVKNYENDISLSVFQKILSRSFRYHCKVHLVLVTRLRQSSYFGNGPKNIASWEKFSEANERFRKTKIWRLVADRDTQQLSMKHIRNVASPTKHVIFIDTTQFQSR